MEMEFLFVPLNLSALLVLLSSFIFLLFKLIKPWRSILPSKNTYTNLPPSPPKLPIIGHLHHLTTGGAAQLPHHAFSSMAQKYGPIMHLQMGEISTVVLSSPEAAKQALKIQDPACAERPETIATKIMWSNGIIASPYGELWRQMRRICILEMLSAKNVRSFDSIRKLEVSRLIDSIKSSAGEPVDISKKLVLFSSSMTSRVSIGKVAKHNDALLESIRDGVALAGWFELADLFPSWKLLNVLSWNKYKVVQIKRKVDAILEVILEEHKMRTRDGEFGSEVEDLVDVLLRISREGEFEFAVTKDNIKGIIYDLFSAGTDTTSSTTDWAMAELMRNPDAMTKVQKQVREVFRGKETIEENDLQQLTYLKQVIKETLRLHPPVTVLTRSCREDCEIEGYSIPARSKVLTNVWWIGRDPKYWDRPEEFLPERFDNSSIDYLGNNFEYIPFGAGRRMCPGINFGIANIMLPLSQMLYHFNWELPKGMVAKDIDMSEEYGVTVARKNPLILVPMVYNSA